MNADGSGQRRLTFHLAEDTMPSWSPSGTRIAFTSDRSGRFEVYVVNADGSGLRQLTHDYGWGPSWSPDGSMIAFTRYSPKSAIFVMNANGTDVRQLTPGMEEVEIYTPRWSPDGTQMLCVLNTAPSSDDFGNELTVNIFEISDLLQGSGETIFRPLPRPGESVNDRPNWSPDGTRIVFSAIAGSHRDLYLVNADGTNLQRLTQTDELDEFSPTWSPDGARIAFQMNTTSGWDIYTIRVDGTDLQRLTTDFANDVAPSWVP
jgi:Tol biopolymer transport system component